MTEDDAWQDRAREMFSIVKAKQRKRKANAGRKGVASRPTRTMGTDPRADDLIRDALKVIREGKS
jgi:hypothetical protein